MDNYRSIDGRGNNTSNPEWGAAGTPLRRVAKSAYEDGISTIAKRGDGSPFHPRRVSNAVHRHTKSVSSKADLSNFVWAWGQFLDHQLDLTEPMQETGELRTPPDDPVLPNASIEFKRSNFVEGTGTTSDNPRQQINQITSYIDASNVYGNNVHRAKLLRAGVDGRLKVTPDPHGDLLPYNTEGLENAARPQQRSGSEFFLAGDVRANEHVVLTAMHTLFVREHNRRCDMIRTANSRMSDEEIYQRARKEVGALMQIITYQEFLPAILGQDALGPYKGYDVTVDASIANTFSTACYRIGHSMLSGVVGIGRIGRTLLLRDLFFRPERVKSLGIDALLDGLAHHRMEEIDNRIIDDVRSFLFHAPDPVGSHLLDLAALNIQRGRDHGLPSYNDCREAYGLSRKTTFADVTSDATLQKALASVYTDVDDIDPWVGGLCEDHVAGASVGEFIRTVLIEQFERLRHGDRFWYANDPDIPAAAKKKLEATKLSEVVQNNTKLPPLPEDVFHVGSAQDNARKRLAELDAELQQREAAIRDHNAVMALVDACGDVEEACAVLGGDPFLPEINATKARSFIQNMRAQGTKPFLGRPIREMLNEIKAIYGPDNRQSEPPSGDNNVRANFERCLAIIPRTRLLKQEIAEGPHYIISAPTFAEARNLCPNERFASEPVAATCSGFLLGSDVIATAGHCIRSNSDLEQFYFVFGYQSTDKGVRRVFPASSVYRGITVIDRRQEGNIDWAVVRLEREVKDITPVLVRQSATPNLNERLYVIGHPSGLPKKYSDGAEIVENDDEIAFLANLDTYGGNSGSAVFNAVTHEVEGILIRGRADFELVTLDDASCYVSKGYPNNIGGEVVCRTSNFLSVLA